MRTWILCWLLVLPLIGWGCKDADPNGDDDDSAGDDDDTAGDDDDTTEWSPPQDLAPTLEIGSWEQIDEALQYVRPGFALTLLDTMVSLTEQYGDADCPTITMSGPPDEVLTEVTGNCWAGDTQFVGGYTLTQSDTGSYIIQLWEVSTYFIRPTPDRIDIEDDEYFFHGRIYYGFNGDDWLGTMDAGLGLLEYGEFGNTMTGFEAHYIGGSPTVPEWNHVFLRGWNEASLNAGSQVLYDHDLMIASNGFGAFTSNAYGVVADEDQCDSEPLTGNFSIYGTTGINFAFDGDTSCDGLVPAYSVDGGGSAYAGDYDGSFW